MILLRIGTLAATASLCWLVACSTVGPGLAHHPVDCAVGFPWADCLEGTPGYNNGGGSETRAEAAKAQAEALGAEQRSADDACKAQLQSPELDPIRAKVELMRAVDQIPPFAITANTSFPTPEERETIARWATIRDGCLARSQVTQSIPPSATPLQRAFLEQERAFAQEIAGHVSALIVALYQGKMTYGEFAQKRYEYGRDGAAAERQFRAASLIADHDRQVEAQRVAQTQLQNNLLTWSAFEQSLQARPANFGVHCNSTRIGNQVSTNCF